MTDEDRQLVFTSNSHYSIGVEIEFQVLDRNTLNLAPLAPLLLEQSPKVLSQRITHEFIRSMLELQTSVCKTLGDVENDLMETCSMAEELAEENGCLLHAASLHPFASYSEQIVSKDSRYERIMEELQITGQRFISQGLHVHIGMSDGDAAMRTSNIIQLYLPLLLSLSTSSPFAEGRDTGLLSYRTKLFEALPQAGIYSFFQDWQSYVEEVLRLQKYGVIDTSADLWWDVRPNSGYGTLEVRICDLPGRFNDILALVAMTQALVAYIAEEREFQQPASLQILRANKWQAVRHGLNGLFVDESEHLARTRIPMRAAVQLLIEKIKPYAADLGSSRYLDMTDRILRFGTSAEYQKQIYRESGSFEKVLFQTHQEFWQ